MSTVMSWHDLAIGESAIGLIAVAGAVCLGLVLVAAVVTVVRGTGRPRDRWERDGWNKRWRE